MLVCESRALRHLLCHSSISFQASYFVGYQLSPSLFGTDCILGLELLTWFLPQNYLFITSSDRENFSFDMCTKSEHIILFFPYVYVLLFLHQFHGDIINFSVSSRFLYLFVSGGSRLLVPAEGGSRGGGVWAPRVSPITPTPAPAPGEPPSLSISHFCNPITPWLSVIPFLIHIHSFGVCNPSHPALVTHSTTFGWCSGIILASRPLGRELNTRHCSQTL